MSKKRPGLTDFGYQQVPASEKQQRVAGVFTSVAGSYDLMSLSYNEADTGHPGARGDAARLWVNQTVVQRTAVLADPNYSKGIHSPKRLDPMALMMLP